MGLMPKLQSVLLTERVLRKVAVGREIRLSTKQYECQQKNDFGKCSAMVILAYVSIFFGFKLFMKQFAIV